MNFLRRLLIACAALGLGTALAGAALGHAELEESDPADGESIAGTPYTLVARFTDELDAARSRIIVRTAAGEQVAEGGVIADDAYTMVVELPELDAGAYAAHWTAVARDGHIERGEISFTVAQAVPTPTVAPTQPGGTPAGSATPPAMPTGQPTTPTPAPTGPSATPSPLPPGPDAEEPATGEILVGLLVAGGLVGAITFFLLRRRTP